MKNELIKFGIYHINLTVGIIFWNSNFFSHVYLASQKFNVIATSDVLNNKG